jgi:hypothetical protein
MLNELDMDLVLEERFVDAYKRYLEGREGKALMQRMKAAETFSLKERSNSDHDQKEYKNATKYLEDKFANRIGEKVVSLKFTFTNFHNLGNNLRIRMDRNFNVSDFCIQET